MESSSLFFIWSLFMKKSIINLFTPLSVRSSTLLVTYRVSESNNKTRIISPNTYSWGWKVGQDSEEMHVCIFKWRLNMTSVMWWWNWEPALCYKHARLQFSTILSSQKDNYKYMIKSRICVAASLWVWIWPVLSATVMSTVIACFSFTTASYAYTALNHDWNFL